MIANKRIGIVLGMLALLAGQAACAQQAEKSMQVRGPFKRDMTLVWIPAGSFTMGTPETEQGRRKNESPRTKVTLTQGYWMGAHEVTHGQWQALMGTDVVQQARLAQMDDTTFHLGAGSMHLRDYFNMTKDSDTLQLVGNVDADLPMIWVSWNEAREFARKLTEVTRARGALPSGYEFRLPTEAEWEYAARAGTTGATYAGELKLAADQSSPTMHEIAWYAGNAREGYTGRAISTANWVTKKEGAAGEAGPRLVGTKLPNAWGLYDMLGNAAEWCMDWDGPLPGGSVTDWQGGKPSPKGRIRRGGGWSTFANNARAGYRNAHEAEFRWVNLGFRVVLAKQSSTP
ncbi:formylglycine-generating enzyme family protein [Steroidobacter sp.]|uniref:formylglycine-generating enzyme family protein n=1 Tax=Steroidobacter sp. TaxID=1978227 RepID=UPI001A45185C|nr:formylglycine-generating enzyme family protein [Steroidobacter sp.]MBL8268299.1 formylglycine-generating enzyme family protein [Steroidobacter sp.]